MSTLYVCRWPNTDVSFVYADDVNHAIELLDEVGGASPDMLEEAGDFMVDFSSSGKLVGLGESTLDHFKKGEPR